MQTRAIIEAACQLHKEGLKVVPEIMIPLVGLVKELRDQKAIVDRVAAEVMKEQGVKIKYLVGTMIEVPRGALTADQIAAEAQFFSFGTNDLTQMTFGFSRDDVGKFLRVYQDKKILDKDPFATIDTEGVGAVVRMGVEKGPQGAAGPEARHLRRARRRPGVDPLLRVGEARLRERVALPHSRSRASRRRRRRWRSRSAIDCATTSTATAGPSRSRRSIRPGSNADSGVRVWADVREPTEADGRRAARWSSGSTRWPSRMRCETMQHPEGRDLRRHPATSSCTASTSRPRARLRDARHRLLPRPERFSSPSTTASAAAFSDVQELCRQNHARPAGGSGRADAPHRRHDGRSLPARGRRARERLDEIEAAGARAAVATS